MNPIERNEIFDLAFRFVTETNENIFLTGNAGTGKTTFLKFLKDNCAKNMVVAAPTGVAAINAGGVTLHSLFQLPFHPFLPTNSHKDELLGKMKFNRQRQQLLRKMELLVIDEISMVRCDTMDAIDTILKSVRRRHDLPFGGVQMLFIGDLFQLPPVAKHDEWRILQEYYSSPFFFDSMAIKQQLPLLIELTTIYRQKENSFVNLLNKVRNNHMTKDDFEDLHMRYKPDFRPGLEEKYITLTSHNNQAEQINHRELQKISSNPFSYEAIIEDDFPENSYPAEGLLILKTDSQVMFLKNDVISKRYFNGKIGVVKSLTRDEIIVDCDGEDIRVEQETWENTRYSLDREGKLDQERLGSFTQFPLRLAWAITIHKSQGLTFEKVMIDAGNAFSSGQVYVALSRCTSLDGIVLLTKIPAAAIYSNENVTKGQQALTTKGSLAQRFAGARQVYTQQILEDIFSFNELDTLANQLSVEVSRNLDKLNKTALDWAVNLKKSVNAEN
ncbi:MAG: AAA family ATPase, partial [Ginsengibacter sp.]